MKVKGIGPIEQNVEKIVLGVAGVALLGVVAMQVLSSSDVQVGNQSVSLDRAFQPVKEEALRVTAQMNAQDPALPEVPVIDLLGAYREQAAAPVAARPQINPLGPRLALSTARVVDDAPVGDAIYGAVRVPAPAAPAAYAFRSTISPAQAASNPEIAAILPVAQPHDKSAVTIEAAFDGRAFQDLLRADPDGEGPQRALPLRWWQDAVEIVGVNAERQMRRPDGTWSAAEPVRPMPGQLNLLTPPTGEERFNPVSLKTTIARARQLWRQVQRPQYLQVIAGRPWVPPSAAADLDAIEARRPEIERLRAQRRAIERQISITQALIERGPSTPRGPTPAPGGVGPDRRTTTPTTNQPAQVDPEIQGLQRRLQSFNDQLVVNEEALADIGVGLDGLPLATWEEGEDGGYAAPMLEDSGLSLWVHDLHVETGATYRYRLQVVVNNPFFGNAAALVPDQQSLASEPFIYGQWSEWTSPAGVEQDRYYFVTAASTADDVAKTPRAQVEVFEFYYGYWRRGTANLAAGDQILASLELPAPELRPIFDLTMPPAPPTPAQPGNRPDRPTRPGVDPTLGYVPGGDRGRGGVPPPPPGGAAPAQPGLPPRALINALATPGPDKLPPTPVDAILLDVTTLPGAIDSALGSRVLTQAVFRAGGGRVEVRVPERERERDLYRRLRSSAADGLRQGIPEVEEEPEEFILPEPEQREYIPPPPGGGGGGGGGGG